MGLSLYCVGLAGYAVATANLVTTWERLAAAPVDALASPSTLADPARLLLASADGLAAGTPGPGLLLGVGVVALALSVTGSVVQFGRGLAGLYAVGAVLPAVWILSRPFAPALLVADLLALTVIPVATGVWFLVDVGRYVRA